MGYAVVSLGSVAVLARTRRYRLFRFSQLLLTRSVLLPFLLIVALSRLVNSSAVILWSFICPLGALIFDEPRRAPRWLLAVLGLVIV
jgi:guanylate cyclase